MKHFGAMLEDPILSTEEVKTLARAAQQGGRRVCGLLLAGQKAAGVPGRALRIRKGGIWISFVSCEIVLIIQLLLALVSLSVKYKQDHSIPFFFF